MLGVTHNLLFHIGLLNGQKIITDQKHLPNGPLSTYLCKLPTMLSTAIVDTFRAIDRAVALLSMRTNDPGASLAARKLAV
jgi:hypothetical protein